MVLLRVVCTVYRTFFVPAVSLESRSVGIIRTYYLSSRHALISLTLHISILIEILSTPPTIHVCKQETEKLSTMAERRTRNVEDSIDRISAATGGSSRAP